MCVTKKQLALLRSELQQLMVAVSQVVSTLGNILQEVEYTPSIKVEGEVILNTPCDDCTKQPTCTTPCEKLESFLPSADAGRSSRCVQTSVPLEVQHSTQSSPRTDSRDLFARYEACRHLLTEKQWKAVQHVHGEGMSQRAAARKLKKSESAISERLRGAKVVMEKFHARNAST